MTTFCVMEQGKSINDPITIEKRELFNTPFSDFYRLNWFCDDDPNAAFSAPGVCWSEGRSLLYEKVPKQYDYYVFIDDDIVFDAPDGAHVPTLMRDFFDEYKPLAGSFYCPDSWSHRPHPRPSLARRIGARLVGKRAGIPSQPFDRAPHPMYSYDLELQFYSASFADAVLPVPFHGSDRTMHYTHFICATQYPLKQLCFYGVQIRNTRSDPHGLDNADTIGTYELTGLPDDSVRTDSDRIVDLFNAGVHDHSYDPHGSWNQRTCQIENRRLQSVAPDKTAVDYSTEDLGKIYDVQSDAWQKRSATIQKMV